MVEKACVVLERFFPVHSALKTALIAVSEFFSSKFAIIVIIIIIVFHRKNKQALENHHRIAFDTF